MFAIVLILIAPSIAFWTLNGFAYLMKLNEGYNGVVTIPQMVCTQILVDSIQVLAASAQMMAFPEHIWNFRYVQFGLGCVVIEVVEYTCHRLLHAYGWQIHKKHHLLVPIHSLGAYYNDIREIFFTGSVLGVTLSLLHLSLLEQSVVSTWATICTVMDHCPSHQPRDKLPRHERHHVRCISADFSQPFTGILDWVFGTRYEDVKQ
jgi:sterol desaturase/sphingolipid hydroxylase (fatty acid hydroxylase superfamily)